MKFQSNFGHFLFIGLVLLFVIFRRKTFFEMKIFNSVVGVFFNEIAYDAQAQLVSCIIQASRVTAVRKPELTVSDPAVDHTFLRLFRYSLTRSYFLTTRNSVFSTKI